MIEKLKEVTDWGILNIPNSIYYVDNSGSLVAHEPTTGFIIKMNKPIRGFSKSRRKFKSLGFVNESFEPVKIKTIAGSNGNKYTIIGGKCSCLGYKYRGKCKHTKEL